MNADEAARRDDCPKRLSALAPAELARVLRSVLLMRPRWLADVTWRLIGITLLVAFAIALRLLLETAMDSDSSTMPGELAKQGESRAPVATLFVLSYAVSGLTIVFVGALLLAWPGPPWWRPLAVAIAVAIGCLSGAALLVAAGDPYERAYGISPIAILLFRARQVLAAWGFAAAAWYFVDRSARRAALLREEEASRTRLQARMLEARLQVLEAQVEPHFIFNTLANIRRLCRIDPARARRMADRFATYLRAALPQIRHNGATLGREVDLARAYLDVQKVRMGRRLACAIDVPESVRSHPFPPMMLISLVENAIKHGLNPSIEGGTIRIGATARESALLVTVADTGRGFTKTMGSGVGLSNIRARLAAMHGERARLALAENVPHGVVATIELPLPGAHVANAAEAALDS